MKTLLVSLLVVIIALIGVSAYFGAFYGVDIEEKDMGPYVFVYEPFWGDYKETAVVFDRVYKKRHKIFIDKDENIN